MDRVLNVNPRSCSTILSSIVRDSKGGPARSCEVHDQIIATDAIANAFTAYRDIPVVYLVEQPGETRGTAVTSVNLKFRPFEIKTIELVFS